MEHLIFLVRQSPDWEALADDYESGRAIDVGRFKPAHPIPGFPDGVERLIDAWNHLFEFNFFRCRQALKDLAFGTVRKIPGARLLNETAYPAAAAAIARTPSLLFYMDDDDWFAPDLPERLSGLDFGPADIAVFPLVRLEIDSFTFVRQGVAAETIVGSRQDFGHRFQTNNYAIRTDRVLPWHIARLKDHVYGSVHADSVGLSDIYFDRIISATNKTPCSASNLPILFQHPDQTLALIRRYSDRLDELAIPESAMWLGPLLHRMIMLFDQILESARVDIPS